MKTDVFLGLTAGSMNVIAFVIYNMQMIVGVSQPNTASRTVWAFLTALNCFSYFMMSKDWIKSILPTMGSVACFVTFVLALVIGKLEPMNLFEWGALCLCLVAGIQWWMYRSATYAQMIMQVTIIVSFIPTYVGVWTGSAVEAPIPWFLWAFAFALGTAVVLVRWQGRYRDLVYPVNCFILHAGVGVLAIPAVRTFF
ncbi:hypothetical protein L0Y46_01665 [bacterium]|nr:hypothetical protein [bacterium]